MVLESGRKREVGTDGRLKVSDDAKVKYFRRHCSVNEGRGARRVKPRFRFRSAGREREGNDS